MPRLMKRQEAPVEGRVVGCAPFCIACGNRRVFWVRRGGANIVALAWEIQPKDTLVACGRCRSRNSVLLDRSDG